MAGPTASVPLGVDATAARVSSMSYADIYGASIDTGPGSAVAGSVGYVSAEQADAAASAQASNPLHDHAGPPGVEGLVELGHELLDNPLGLAFVVAGGLLLLLWFDLA